MGYLLYDIHTTTLCRSLTITSDIIALLVLGLLSTISFLFWQHYLEKRIDNEHPASQRLPPPIMRPSIWTRANGRFAVMQMIAFLNWASFMSYNFWIQLFYQEYLHLTPVQTMLRLLPMFVTGIVWYVALNISPIYAPQDAINRRPTAMLSLPSLLGGLMLCTLCVRSATLSSDRPGLMITLLQ